MNNGIKDIFPIATRTEEIFISMSKMERWQDFTVGYVKLIARSEAGRQIKAEREVAKILGMGNSPRE